MASERDTPISFSNQSSTAASARRCRIRSDQARMCRSKDAARDPKEDAGARSALMIRCIRSSARKTLHSTRQDSSALLTTCCQEMKRRTKSRRNVIEVRAAVRSALRVIRCECLSPASHRSLDIAGSFHRDDNQG
jgi:hypothetical protein